MNNDDLVDNNNETTFITGKDAVSSMQAIFERFMTNYSPFGFQTRNEDVAFHPIPYKPEADDPLLLREPWRITLELYEGEKRKVLGLDLFGDLILGRGESRPGRIVLDLEPYEAQKFGVSREHVMLRPTASRLYVIDQGSTNGTTVNGAASGRGVATSLKNEDMLALGNMVFVVHVLDQPG